MAKKTKSDLKKEYLEYYRDLPNHSLASAYIGKSVKTTWRWRQEDDNFEKMLSRARVEWAKKEVDAIGDRKWILERTLREEFSPPVQKQEHSGKIEHKHVVELPTEGNMDSEPGTTDGSIKEETL